MRLFASRGYWLPCARIPHLRRIAFLGDSYVFGQGVAPDETLPACAEKHLNETSSGWPIEAVNLGISGYNLWNSWQSFRGFPQVYDAIVLTLCSNDAELFGRTYRVKYAGGTSGRFWRPAHPYREGVTACFDDMASFSRASNLPLAVCFYNVWPGQPLAKQAGNLEISKVLADLCAPRGIAFVDFHVHFMERNMPLDGLVVSEADLHPSKMAHDAAARHLALTLRQLGWLERMGTAAFARVADRIQLAAQDLVEKDSYPTDIALRWAASALEAKRRAAKRMQSTALVADFSMRAERVAAALEAASLVWHACAKALAIGEEARGRSRYGWFLWHIDEEMLKVEELCATIGKVEIGDLIDDQDLSAPLPEQMSVLGLFGNACMALSRVCGALEEAKAARDSLRKAVADSWIEPPDGVARGTSDLAEVNMLGARIEYGAQAFLATLDRLGATASLAIAQVPDSERRRIVGLLQLSLDRIVQSFEHVQKMLASITERSAPTVDQSSIEVVLAVKAAAASHPCLVEAQMSYLAPRRFALRDQCYFLPRNSSVAVSFRFPVVYAGHLTLSFDGPEVVAGTVEIDLVKVDIWNSTTRRNGLDRAVFSKLGTRKLVSQTFYLV